MVAYTVGRYDLEQQVAEIGAANSLIDQPYFCAANCNHSGNPQNRGSLALPQLPAKTIY